jgi:hypothetical protein
VWNARHYQKFARDKRLNIPAGQFQIDLAGQHDFVVDSVAWRAKCRTEPELTPPAPPVTKMFFPSSEKTLFLLLSETILPLS